LALDEYRSKVLCPCGCGYPAEIAQDPMTEFKVLVDDPTRCHVRTALVRKQREWEGAHPEGLLWRASMRD